MDFFEVWARGGDGTHLSVAFGDLPFFVAEGGGGELAGDFDLLGGEVKPLGEKGDFVERGEWSEGDGVEGGQRLGGFFGQRTLLAVGLVGGLERGREIVAVDLLEKGEDASDFAAPFDLGTGISGFLDMGEHGLAAIDQGGFGGQGSVFDQDATDHRIVFGSVEEAGFSGVDPEVIFDDRFFDLVLDFGGDRGRAGDRQVVEIAGVAHLEIGEKAEDLEDLAVEFETDEVEEEAGGGGPLGEAKDRGGVIFDLDLFLMGGEDCEEVDRLIEGRRGLAGGRGEGARGEGAEEGFEIASKESMYAGESDGGEGVAKVEREEVVGIGEVGAGIGDDGTTWYSPVCGFGDFEGIEEAFQDPALDFFEGTVGFVDIAPFERARFGDRVVQIGFFFVDRLQDLFKKKRVHIQPLGEDLIGFSGVGRQRMVGADRQMGDISFAIWHDLTRLWFSRSDRVKQG